jgi:hypothetical protein
MNSEQISVFNYLNNYALGKPNRKTSSQIRDVVNLPSGGVTNENIREIIRQLIDLGKPIGSDSKGYFIIENRTELNDVTDSLDNRADEIKARANKLKSNFP